MSLAEMPVPVPGSGEVVLDVRAVGLCHSDVGFVDGTITSLLKFTPIVLGHEIAGIISAIGPDVTHFAVGDRAGVPATVDGPGTSMNGGYAEKVLAHESQVVHVPDGVPWEQAAPATCGARTAYRALVTAGQVEAGMIVGIIGFGGLGSLGAQIAVGLGATVYVAEISDQAQGMARDMGLAGVASDIREFSAKELDLIVDFAGYGVTAVAAIEAIRPGGRIVQIGLGEETATVSIQALTMKEITWVGAANGANSECTAALEMIADGKLGSDVQTIGFNDIPAALDRVANGTAGGRLVALY